MSFREFDALLGPDDAESKSVARPRPVILVVDDDDALRSALVLCLQTDYEVRACASATAALGALGPEVRAIVLDVMMPERDGFWTQEQVGRRYPALPVIFFSAFDALHARLDPAREPFGFVSKGGESEELFDMIRRAVEHAEALAAKGG